MRRVDCINCEFKSKAAKHLSEDELQILAANCARVIFRPGENIIREGALSSNIAYLKQGLVKLHITGPAKEQIIKVSKSPTYLGVPTAIGDKLNHYSVTALTECEVCFIDVDVFKQFLYRNGMFAYEIVLQMSRNELENFRNCVNRVQKQLRGKVAQALLDFADRIFESDEFELPLTREDFANLLDASRESVCRVMSELEADGYIAIDGRKISILERKKLEQLSTFG